MKLCTKRWNYLVAFDDGRGSHCDYFYLHVQHSVHLCITLRPTNNSLVALTSLNLLIIFGNLHMFYFNERILEL